MDDDVEKILSGLLNSKKGLMTVKMFCREFEEMIGYPLPFKKHGYLNPVDYLRNMPDTVVVLGTDVNATLIPVMKEKSHHIQEMVMKQRDNSKKSRFNSHPRRNQHMLFNGPVTMNRFANNFTNKPIINWPVNNNNKQNYYQNLERREPIHKEHNSVDRVNVPIEEVVRDSVKANIKSENSYDAHTNQRRTITVEENRSFDLTPSHNKSWQKPHNVVTATESHVSTSIVDPKPYSFDLPPSHNKKWQKSHNDVTATESYVSTSIRDPKPYKDSNYSYINNSSQGAIPKRQQMFDQQKMIGPFEQTKNTCTVPKFVVDRLQMVIDEYPDGITCNSLPRLYSQKFGETLTFNSYGYPSLILMCKDIDIFYIVQPESGDYQLYNKKNKKPKSKYLLEVKNSDSDVEDTSDSNHELEFENYQMFSYYPPDVVTFEDTIPGQWIDSDTKEGSFINVVVTEVYDPSKFWIVINIENLNLFMDDLQFFYKSNNNLRMPKSHMKVGLICVAVLYDEFHRVTICNVASINTNIIKVFAFDYGSVRQVSTNDVYYLHKQFAHLPQQCIRARLAKIYPPVEKTPWCQTARTNFCRYVADRSLFAKIHKILEHNTLSLYLIDKENNRVINDALVEDKVAVLTSEVQKPWKRDERNFPVINDIYLIPLFEDLESGSAYNFDERLDLEKKSVLLSKIFPEYFKDITKDISDLTNENFNFKGLNKSFIEALESISSSIKSTNDNTDEVSGTGCDSNESAQIQEIDDSIKDELLASGTTKSRNFLNSTEIKHEQTTQKVEVVNVACDQQEKQPERNIRLPPGYTETDVIRNRHYNALFNNSNNYNVGYQTHSPMSVNYGAAVQMNFWHHFVPQPVPIGSIIPFPYMSVSPYVDVQPYPNYNQFIQQPIGINNNLNSQFNRSSFSPNTSGTSLNYSSNSSATNFNRSDLSHLNKKQDTTPKTTTLVENSSVVVTDDQRQRSEVVELQPVGTNNNLERQFNGSSFSPNTSGTSSNYSPNLSATNFNPSDLTHLNKKQDTSPKTTSLVENSSVVIANDQQQRSEVVELQQICDKETSNNVQLNESVDRVIEVELKSKMIHLIFYNNDTFALVKELLDNYTAVTLSMIRIIRLVRTQTSCAIEAINLNSCPAIKADLCKFGLIAKYKIMDEIHVIPMDHIPEFLSFFGINIDGDKFKEFQNTLE